jgi:dethiobiotin synthase
MRRYRGAVEGPGRGRLRYWKPIQTGTLEDDDTATVRWLAACDEAELCEAGVRLAQPVSPHLAARLSGVSIDLETVVEGAAGFAASDRWIVEGAGGVLVPLNDTALMADLMVRLSLPVLVVARTTLGTINHTLLTIEAIRHRALTVAGVLLSGEPNRDNRNAIEAYGRVPVVGDVGRLPAVSPETLAAVAPRIDPEGRLLEVFR